ncbi:MAG TPA: hypothetical protein DCR69_00260 [Clostridium sp.]|nr:hypothetical protein [Clostridium sp.]
MKIEWKKPILSQLAASDTNETEYIDFCNWQEPMSIKFNNEDYTNPNIQPADHPDWVWCYKHNRWHPKNHGSAPKQS